MNRYLPIISLALLMLNTACSTVMEGRTQAISIDSFPAGAKCLVKDNDVILARVQTPGTATIEKSKNDVLIECTKEGYITASRRNKSDVAITSVGNMAFGQFSFVGNAIDSVSGASHKYDSRMFLSLNPLPPVARMDEPMIASAAPAVASAPVTPASSADTVMAAPYTEVTSGEGAAPQQAQQPQISNTLANALRNQQYTVTHQSLDEVIRSLMNQPPQPQVATQEVAALTAIPIQHNAE